MPAGGTDSFRNPIPADVVPPVANDCGGGDPSRIPASVYACHGAFVRMVLDSGDLDLPGLWMLASKASDDLVRSRGNTDMCSVLESLMDSDYVTVAGMMEWHAVNRGESISADPDYTRFHSLAKARGTPLDTSFFGLMSDLKNSSGLYHWQRMVTDYSGCNELGNAALVRGLLRRASYLSAGTTSYSSFVPDLESELRSGLNSGFCACDNQPKTRQGFEEALGTVPSGHPLRPLLDTIQDALRANRPKDRYECQPG